MSDIPIAMGVTSLGDLPLASGGTLRDARLSWKSFGQLSAARDNVVVYPTSFAVQHADVEWLVGPGRILDPRRWFIVIVDMFGNGLSSSPSNMADYPALVTAEDNARAQRLLLQHLWGVQSVACVYGWSMGAQQAYHWAALFPRSVARIVVNCGSARTSPHNQVFLASLIATLEAAPEYAGAGRFSARPAAALRSFGRIYAGWALSQAFYRAGLHLRAAKVADLEAYLSAVWDTRFAHRDPGNLLAHLRGWSASDISANPRHQGDLEGALHEIEAAVLLMPGRTDLYFRVEDNAWELQHLRRARLVPIESVWGHLAGNPGANPEDEAFIREWVGRWLESFPVS